MKVYLEKKRSGVYAEGEFDLDTKTLTVLKGSRVSETISYSEKFRGDSTIEKNRIGNVENGVLVKDVIFKSASTAANFVSGSSTNGLVAWKNSDGTPLREFVKK